MSRSGMKSVERANAALNSQVRPAPGFPALANEGSAQAHQPSPAQTSRLPVSLVGSNAAPGAIPASWTNSTAPTVGIPAPGLVPRVPPPVQPVMHAHEPEHSPSSKSIHLQPLQASYMDQHTAHHLLSDDLSSRTDDVPENASETGEIERLKREHHSALLSTMNAAQTPRTLPTSLVSPNSNESQELSAVQALPQPAAALPDKQIVDAVPQSEQDRYGLRGMLGIIRIDNPDASMMSLGSDLAALGLNLNQHDDRPLYSTFLSPWTKSIRSKAIADPDYHIPACYSVQPLPPASGRMQSFSDDTLFYIFYSMPRDLMQELAAQELTNRNWRWHKEYRLWLTKEPGTEPVMRTEFYERGIYVLFHPLSWERIKREFTLSYDALDTRMPEMPVHGRAQAAPTPIGSSR